MDMERKNLHGTLSHTALFYSKKLIVEMEINESQLLWDPTCNVYDFLNRVFEFIYNKYLNSFIAIYIINILF